MTDGGTRSAWAIDKKFDLLFFIGPVLAGLVYFAAAVNFPEFSLILTLLIWMVFAQGHFGSTWFIYADKKNRAYFSEHALVYFVIPALIFALVFLIGYAHFALLLVLISVVSLYHVSRQSIGILAIYRGKNGERNAFDRKVEEMTIFAWSLFFAGYGALHIPHFMQFVVILPLAKLGVAVLFGCALVGTLLIVIAAFRRERNSLPKSTFLLVSCLTYLPYIYATPLMERVQNFEIAGLIALVPHYMQYMGLVWLVDVNKYKEGTEYAHDNPFLAWVVANKVRIFALIMLYGAAMGFIYYGVPATLPLLGVIGPLVVSALMMIHFYIDAFIWRFGNPFYRETVLPFVRR